MQKRTWGMITFIIPAIVIGLVVIVLPHFTFRTHPIYTVSYIYIGIMSFLTLLRFKSIWLNRNSKTFDQITTILTWIIATPIFLFLGITGFLLVSCSKKVIYKTIWTISIVILFILGVRIHFHGKMPKKQAIIIANHCSWLDDILNTLIMWWSKWKVVFAPEIKRVFLAAFFLKYIGVPVDRTSDASRKTALRKMFRVIKQEYNLLMYPEGKRLRVERDEDQYLLPFEDGAFALSEATKVPIQPVVISWTYLFKPRSGQWWYSPRTIHIYWLEPLTIFPGEEVAQFNQRVWNLMEQTLKQSLNVK